MRFEDSEYECYAIKKVILSFAKEGTLGAGLVEVRLDSEQQTLWLSLQQIADLFERDKSVISRHFRNIYTEGELKIRDI